jgi:hypothetical protein
LVDRLTSPPKQTVPRYVELGESLMVSPLKQQDTLTSFGDEMYQQDLQRHSDIDQELQKIIYMISCF